MATTKIPVDVFLTNLPDVLKHIGVSAGGTPAHDIVEKMYGLAIELHDEVQRLPRSGDIVKATERNPLLRGAIVVRSSWGWGSGLSHARMTDAEVRKHLHP